MADQAQDPFAIHDVILKDVTRMLPNSQLGFFKVLTFYVGDHGPFTKEWPTANFDANVAKKYMQDEVQQLRLIAS
jgi:hypothetical protein